MSWYEFELLFTYTTMVNLNIAYLWLQWMHEQHYVCPGRAECTFTSFCTHIRRILKSLNCCNYNENIIPAIDVQSAHIGWMRHTLTRGGQHVSVYHFVLEFEYTPYI